MRDGIKKSPHQHSYESLWEQQGREEERIGGEQKRDGGGEKNNKRQHFPLFDLIAFIVSLPTGW